MIYYLRMLDLSMEKEYEKNQCLHFLLLFADYSFLRMLWYSNRT